MIKVRVKANAFLYRMVRDMVGALAKVGWARWNRKRYKLS